ncbi:hypothetical protein IQ249_24360 [Lusitaniella coriacea LEGE 07157]|uniref:Uncharacterized protein n=1 Tax=Lusitaniella coriacea LEGE 07157 TaxID=945747 RepID=A0A8J7IXV6_9CYAN|nr:hypothetical protein [Lusitaniella coriacea LEGE 07157]
MFQQRPTPNFPNIVGNLASIGCGCDLKSVGIALVRTEVGTPLRFLGWSQASEETSDVATSSCSAIAQSGGRDAGTFSGISAVR